MIDRVRVTMKYFKRKLEDIFGPVIFYGQNYSFKQIGTPSP